MNQQLLVACKTPEAVDKLDIAHEGNSDLVERVSRVSGGPKGRWPQGDLGRGRSKSCATEIQCRDAPPVC